MNFLKNNDLFKIIFFEKDTIYIINHLLSSKIFYLFLYIIKYNIINLIFLIESLLLNINASIYLKSIINTKLLLIKFHTFCAFSELRKF